MKHITILILVATAFCFASCHNPDSSDATITDTTSINSSSSTGSAVTGTGSARDTGRMRSLGSNYNSSVPATADSSSSTGSAVTGTGSSRDSGKGSFR